MILKECKLTPILIDSRFLRKGILLELTNQEGKIARAEISPLPGYNKETLADAMQQVQKLKQRLLRTWWTKQSLHYLDNLGLYPSVYFGVESALLDLLDPLPNEPKCSTYALLFGSPEEILARAKEAFEEGLRLAKVKLGHLSTSVAHSIVDKLRKIFRLRIDLNQKWSLQETLSFCEKYPQDQFEYIEEPVSNPQDLLHFPYPFALDETLRQSESLSPLLVSKYLKALILKPTMLYPLSPYIHLGKNVVLTSSFEGSIGIGQIKKLVHRLGLAKNTHGLDTLRYFDENQKHMSDCLLEKTST